MIIKWIGLQTLDGKSETCARMLLGNKKAESLIHNNIYTAQELEMVFFIKTQKNEKLPMKFKCIRGI